MKLKFDKPMTANFIRTNVGLIPIKELSKDDLEEYIKLVTKELRRKYSDNKTLREGEKE